ncbi:MAG: hypothetical protein ACI4VW_03375 [Acutalibacteraceae bacterium]
MKAVVYTSQCGHTAEYAQILGKLTGLRVYSLNDAENQLEKNTQIIYLGWLMANTVQGLKKATKKFKISAVCGVGLCDTGAMLAEVKKANALPEDFPLFTMQGGMDKTKLRGAHKLMINMLAKGLASQKERSETDERMLYLLTHSENCVSEKNVSAFMEWYNQN